MSCFMMFLIFNALAATREGYTGGVISRRAVLALPCFAVFGSAACGRRRGGAGFRGYAFVANQEGQAIAAVDLEALAVARDIPLAGSPTSVLAGARRPFVYALTAGNGTVHEIAVDRLQFTRKLTVASSAVGMQMAPDDNALYVLAREPKALIRIALAGASSNVTSGKWNGRWRLLEEPVGFPRWRRIT